MKIGFFWDVTLCSVVVAEQYAVLVCRIQEWTKGKVALLFLFEGFCISSFFIEDYC
jgi:hypothetical protein